MQPQGNNSFPWKVFMKHITRDAQLGEPWQVRPQADTPLARAAVHALMLSDFRHARHGQQLPKPGCRPHQAACWVL
jgi:hypothetical protein